jgi:hypothetical protein
MVEQRWLSFFTHLGTMLLTRGWSKASPLVSASLPRRRRGVESGLQPIKRDIADIEATTTRLATKVIANFNVPIVMVHMPRLL